MSILERYAGQGVRVHVRALVFGGLVAGLSALGMTPGVASPGGMVPQAVPQAPSSPALRGDAREPLHVVEAFYNWHLASSKASRQGLWPQLESQRAHLTPALYDKMRAVQERVATHKVVYDCDLLVGSQGGFWGYRIVRYKGGDNRAEVTLKLANTIRGPKLYSAYNTLVTLERVQGTWRIADLCTDVNAPDRKARPLSSLLDEYLRP